MAAPFSCFLGRPFFILWREPRFRQMREDQTVRLQLCQDESNSPRSYEDRSPRRISNSLRTRPSFVGGFFMLTRPSSWAYLEPSTSKLLYILVYNSLWLTPVSPRLTIVLVAGKLLGVVRIVSHGSNMGFDGESEDRPFGENGRRHGTAVVADRLRFSDLGQIPFTSTTKQISYLHKVRSPRIVAAQNEIKSSFMGGFFVAHLWHSSW